MKGLDLFSGQRTALAAFKDWDITYIDIIDGNDIRDFKPQHEYDFIWASPPCVEYSQFRHKNKRLIPDRGLWLEAIRVIDRGKKNRNTPWVIENNWGARYWWGKPKYCVSHWCFWGYFPEPRFPKGLKKDTEHIRDPVKRAIIPYAISEAFYNAIKNNGKP